MTEYLVNFLLFSSFFQCTNSIASQAIILYKRVYEALLLMPSKSALRAVRGKKWVAKQVAELCRVIAQIGVPTGDGRIFATFGQMFEA